jgi:hypothetical protein
LWAIELGKMLVSCAFYLPGGMTQEVESMDASLSANDILHLVLHIVGLDDFIAKSAWSFAAVSSPVMRWDFAR